MSDKTYCPKCYKTLKGEHPYGHNKCSCGWFGHESQMKRRKPKMNKPDISNATSRPWQTVTLDGDIYLQMGNGEKQNSFGGLLAKIGEPLGADRKANAELIVRCVNGWDSLVAQRDSLLEACKRAEYVLEYLAPYLEEQDKINKTNWRGTPCESVTTCTLKGNLKHIKQAITKATEGR